MGANSRIPWCDHTFNAWMGCEKISPACKYCYAAAWADRFHLDVWGRDSPRKMTSDGKWKEPGTWNNAAVKAGTWPRVFVNSLSDVFEVHPDAAAGRERLWPLVRRCYHLTWMFLTKRPENIQAMLPEDLRGRSNVWVGVTVESPEYLWRIDRLTEIDCGVRFVSFEPLLEEVSLWRTCEDCDGRGHYGRVEHGIQYEGQRGQTAACDVCGGRGHIFPEIDWAIIGGESKQQGIEPRKFCIGWADALVVQCRKAYVPVFMKQLGDKAYEVRPHPIKRGESVNVPVGAGYHGEDFEKFPKRLQIRELPTPRGEPLPAPPAAALGRLF